MNRREFALACVCVPPFLRTYITAQAQNLERSWLGTPAARLPVNLARYGQLKSWLDPQAERALLQQTSALRLSPTTETGTDFGFEWPEFRTVNEVIIQFDGKVPDAATVFVEYWDGLTALQGSWKAFEQGLIHGNHLQIQAGKMTYRFEQRRTCKVRMRLTDRRQTTITSFAILGPSIWKAGEILIEWGHLQTAPWNGQIESYNGEILATNPLGRLSLDATHHWKSKQGEQGGLHVAVLYASGMDVDRSILTIRSSEATACSFLPGEAIEDEPIDIVDYGIYVRHAQSKVDRAAYQASNQGKSRVIDAVPREQEQTLKNAYARINARRVTLSFVGAEANNQKFGVAPDGHFVIGNTNPLAGDPITPGFAVYFDTAERPFLFQSSPPSSAVFTSETRATAWVVEKTQRLKEGWLPLIDTLWSQNTLEFERRDFGTLLQKEQASDKLIGNEPAILISRLRIRNSSPTNEIATYFVRPWKPAGEARLTYGPIPVGSQEAWSTMLRDDLVVASASGEEVLIAYFDTHQKGTLSLDPEHNAVRYELPLAPGEEHIVHTIVPGWEPSVEEAAKLRGLDYDQAEAGVTQHWKAVASHSMRIQIPDEHLQNLFNASLHHFGIGLTKNGETDQYFPNTAMFHYGSIGSESSPIIRALDMLGLHHLAERCLEAFLATQGQFLPEGDYTNKEGGFYRFWPIYTVDQGGVLWALADHYRLTRDDEWLRRVAPQVVAGCDFLIRERKRTMTVDATGEKPLHHGLAPAGCVADPRDWQYSFMLNAWFYAGLKNCADILVHVDPAKGASLQEEAADYKNCILRALKESVALSPVTRLRDNTSIPSVPPYLGLRGFSTDVKDSVDPDRRHGYAYDCTIGPFHLFNCGVLEPDDPIVTAMLNYFEDRFFLFTPLTSRVNLDHLATDWFNLGGFEKLQPYYVHYQEAYLLRDQIPNFVRGFYNTLASIADPQTLTFQEELDFGGGQPHKTHEEAWFIHQTRKMLVVEIGSELHFARGTPRLWLKGENEISVQHAPTYFGAVSYSIRSSADSRTISAQVDPPTEQAPSRMTLRLRHPDHAPIKSVQLNGHAWTRFDAKNEWVELPESRSKISLVAYY